LTLGTTTDLTAAGTLDWVEWGNGQTSLPFTLPQKIGGTIIDPTLTPLGDCTPGRVGDPFAPPPITTILDFSWTDGTEDMAGGGLVGTVVSETIDPAQFSYPLDVFVNGNYVGSITLDARGDGELLLDTQHGDTVLRWPNGHCGGADDCLVGEEWTHTTRTWYTLRRLLLERNPSWLAVRLSLS
jgi:hypothetical protein